MRIEDERGGFELSPPEGNKVAIRVWGFWSDALASSFEPNVLRHCPVAAPVVVIDARALIAQRDDAQAAFGRVFLALMGRHGQVEVLTTSPLAKLQFTRILSKYRITGVVLK